MADSSVGWEERMSRRAAERQLAEEAEEVLRSEDEHQAAELADIAVQHFEDHPLALDEGYFGDLVSEWYSANYPGGARLRSQDRDHLAKFLAQRTKARLARIAGAGEGGS